jgi:hypothetical protein
MQWSLQSHLHSSSVEPLRLSIVLAEIQRIWSVSHDRPVYSTRPPVLGTQSVPSIVVIVNVISAVHGGSNLVGAIVGDGVGNLVGDGVGERVGDLVGLRVGFLVGLGV